MAYICELIVKRHLLLKDLCKYENFKTANLVLRDIFTQLGRLETLMLNFGNWFETNLNRAQLLFMYTISALRLNDVSFMMLAASTSISTLKLNNVLFMTLTVFEAFIAAFPKLSVIHLSHISIREPSAGPN